MEVDDRGDPEILEHLITQQYWRSDFSFPEGNDREYQNIRCLIQLLN